MLESGEWLYYLQQKHNGRRSLIVAGDTFGDNCKRTVESAIRDHFDYFIRVSGGSNTGGTCYIQGQDGKLHEMIFHLIPSGWPAKTGIISDWVLVDLKRAVAEIDEIIKIVGQPKADLFISRRAPLWLPYYGLVEAYLEMMKGADAVGTTKRGIAPTISAIDLRIGPLVGHLLYPDLLRKWVTNCYRSYEVVFKALEEALKGTKQEFNLADFHPDKITDELLVLAERIKPFITYTENIIRKLLLNNEAILFGLTQGFGLHRNGTYPYNSATQTIASAVAYCAAIPMHLLGATVLASKFINTRVGWGPYPTGWWDRREAEQFPILHPYLFSVLPEHDPDKRQAFLDEYRQKINSGDYTSVDLAMYMQVLLNNLGATTKRGREPGAPDLYLTACACWANGVDAIAMSQMNVLSGLKMNFKMGIGYSLDGQPLRVPTMLTPVEEYDRLEVLYKGYDVDLVGVDLWGSTEMPPVIREICDDVELYTGTKVGLVSNHPQGDKGKIFLDPR